MRLVLKLERQPIGALLLELRLNLGEGRFGRLQLVAGERELLLEARDASGGGLEVGLGLREVLLGLLELPVGDGEFRLDVAEFLLGLLELLLLLPHLLPRLDELLDSLLGLLGALIRELGDVIGPNLELLLDGVHLGALLVHKLARAGVEPVPGFVLLLEPLLSLGAHAVNLGHELLHLSVHNLRDDPSVFVPHLAHVRLSLEPRLLLHEELLLVILQRLNRIRRFLPSRGEILLELGLRRGELISRRLQLSLLRLGRLLGGLRLDHLRLELVDALLLFLGFFIRGVGSVLHLVPLLLGGVRAVKRLGQGLLLTGALQRTDSLLRAEELRDGDDQARGCVGGATGFLFGEFFIRIRLELSLVARGGGSVGDALEPLHLTLRSLRALDRLDHLLRGASLGFAVERDVSLEGTRDGSHVLLRLDGGSGFVSRLPQLVHQLLHLVRVVVLHLLHVRGGGIGGGLRGGGELVRPGLPRGDCGLLGFPPFGNLTFRKRQLSFELLDPRFEVIALGLRALRAFRALLELTRERAQGHDFLR